MRLFRHPFGEICGYVCPHEQNCQGNCVLNKRGAAVRMGMVEREVFAKNPYAVLRLDTRAEKKSVAVVGAGVAGLTFAVKMYEQGADVTIYEPNRPLSTLRLIPEFRLPQQAVTRIEQQIEGKFRFVKQAVNSDVLRQLADSYDVVFVATGANVERKMNVDGECFATPYSVFLDMGGEFWQKNPSLKGKTIAIVGGGNTAMDCARLAKKAGADVTVVYRRTKQDMPAFAKEIASAESEGVRFVFNVAPTELSKRDGKIQLTLAGTLSEGRDKLVLTDKLCVLTFDAVVSALGSSFDKTLLRQVTSDGKLLSDVYIGGDAVGGKTVAQAVADALSCAKTAQSKFEKIG